MTYCPIAAEPVGSLLPVFGPWTSSRLYSAVTKYWPRIAAGLVVVTTYLANRIARHTMTDLSRFPGVKP